MNIPITKRVMMGGSKKSCGCPSTKSPAEFNAGLRKAYKEGKLNPGLEAAMEANDPETPKATAKMMKPKATAKMMKPKAVAMMMKPESAAMMMKPKAAAMMMAKPYAKKYKNYYNN